MRDSTLHDMIYTCYDMIRDCRAGRADGWTHFISCYVPVIRKLLEHYLPGQATPPRIIEIVRALYRPESGLFDSLDPSPERWFVAELRQRVLSNAAGLVSGDLAPETLSDAFESFTLLEKQAVWLETMRYTPERAGVLLRMARSTVEKIRDKAAERLRAHMEHWSRTILADQGLALSRAAAATSTPDCVPAKAFLDVLDGRTTWHGREELERHVRTCWHCIDHFCRLAEVLELLRGLTPLAESEAEPIRRALGITNLDRRGWRRWLPGG